MEKNRSVEKSMLTLIDRTVFEMSGVEGVKGFDDDFAVLSLNETELVIYGEGLNIIDLNKDSKKIKILGKIDALNFGSTSKRRRR